ncbi:MAG: hypothetical protein KKH12_06625 [Gammaproteobacteria bacterium]|nr:hypothetical protein [Gammaproteobacteria bacterium]MBU1481334.1 hypothetical protein [Gammaproteobacteria bacterium]
MRSNSRALFFCLGLLNTGIAFAGPADYVYTPTVEYGEKEIDFKYGSARQKDGTRKQVASVGFGYAARENWFTEIYLKHERAGDQTANLAEWENKFQLTETGKYAVDIGLITELEAPLSDNVPWEFRFGPLFQTESGKLQLNGNLLFERAFGKADESGAPYTTNFLYQWQAKYRWQPEFEYGLQGLGELGKWNDWSKQAEQIHNAGPAVFGKFVLGKRQAIRYNAAWLFGASEATPKHTFRMQVEYEY